MSLQLGYDRPDLDQFTANKFETIVVLCVLLLFKFLTSKPINAHSTGNKGKREDGQSKTGGGEARMGKLDATKTTHMPWQTQ